MRLIDADELTPRLEFIREAEHQIFYGKESWGFASKCITAVEDAPTIEERKMGKWLCSDDLYETAVCSCCGWDTTEPWQQIKSWFEFCPHCGADMRDKEGVQDD